MFRGSKNFVVALLTIALSACATTYVPPEPKDSYPGRISSKQLINNPNKAAELARAEAQYREALFLVAIGGVFGGAVGGAIVGGASGDALVNGDQISGEPYRYEIDMASNKKMVIIHPHSGFEVGDCVAVLVGKKSGKVTMTYGSQCSKSS